MKKTLVAVFAVVFLFSVFYGCQSNEPTTPSGPTLTPTLTYTPTDTPTPRIIDNFDDADTNNYINNYGWGGSSAGTVSSGWNFLTGITGGGAYSLRIDVTMTADAACPGSLCADHYALFYETTMIGPVDLSHYGKLTFYSMLGSTTLPAGSSLTCEVRVYYSGEYVYKVFSPPASWAKLEIPYADLTEQPGGTAHSKADILANAATIEYYITFKGANGDSVILGLGLDEIQFE